MSNDKAAVASSWQRMIERACEKARVNKLTAYDLREHICSSRATNGHSPSNYPVYALLKSHRTIRAVIEGSLFARKRRDGDMKNQKEIERVNAREAEDAWLEYWRWWRSDRLKAQFELEPKPKPYLQTSYLPGLKASLREKLMKLLNAFELHPKISH